MSADQSPLLFEAHLGMLKPANRVAEEAMQAIRGRVRSLPRYVNSLIAGGQRRIAGKEMAIQSVKGYPGFLGRRADASPTTVYVHRLIAMTFVPNPEGKPHVNHKDGDKANFAPENLEWVTHLENMRHAFATGLAHAPQSGPGDKSPAAKLTWADVDEIRRRLDLGSTQTEIARTYGLAKGTISFIARNETWVIRS